MGLLGAYFLVMQQLCPVKFLLKAWFPCDRKARLDDATYLTDSFVFIFGHFMDFKAMRYESISFIIALLTNNTGFGPGSSYSDWQNSSRDQSNLEPY